MTQVRQLLAAAATAALLVTLMPAPADAHHLPSRYCSSSGDVCQSVRRVDGTRRLRIRAAARYFRTFHLCVLDPDGYEICAPFKLRKRSDGTFGRSVKWARHFPSGGPGRYRVTWWARDDRIGARLGFHVRR